MFNRLSLLLTVVSFCFGQEVYTLDDCIRLALENNRNLRVAQLQVSSAEADKKGSLAVILPRISASTGSFQQGSYTNLQFGIPVPESEYHSGSISLSQNIFDGGNWWNQIALSKNIYQLSVENELATRISTVLGVKRAYYEHLKNIELLEVARQQVELSEQQVERVRLQYEVEAVAKTDLLKQQVLLGEVQVQLLNQEAILENSIRVLANTMGINVNSKFDLSQADQKRSTLESQDELWKIVAERNQAIFSRRTQITASDIRVKIARAGYFPSISASLGYSGSSDKIDQLYSDVDKHWRQSLSLSISYPLFTGLQRSSQLQRAKIDAEIAREEFDRLTRDLRVQFGSYYRQWENIRRSIPIYTETKASAEEDLRLVQEMYNLGASTILDVLNAQLSLARANSSLVRASYDERILRSELNALASRS